MSVSCDGMTLQNKNTSKAAFLSVFEPCEKTYNQSTSRFVSIFGEDPRSDAENIFKSYEQELDRIDILMEMTDVIKEIEKMFEGKLETNVTTEQFKNPLYKKYREANTHFTNSNLFLFTYGYRTYVTLQIYGLVGEDSEYNMHKEMLMCMVSAGIADLEKAEYELLATTNILIEMEVELNNTFDALRIYFGATSDEIYENEQLNNLLEPLKNAIRNNNRATDNAVNEINRRQSKVSNFIKTVKDVAINLKSIDFNKEEERKSVAVENNLSSLFSFLVVISEDLDGKKVQEPLSDYLKDLALFQAIIIMNKNCK